MKKVLVKHLNLHMKTAYTPPSKKVNTSLVGIAVAWWQLRSDDSVTVEPVVVPSANCLPLTFAALIGRRCTRSRFQPINIFILIYIILNSHVIVLVVEVDVSAYFKLPQT